MTSCTHRLSGKEEQIWLPTTPNNFGSVERHQWCKECGLIQNKSDDRPKKIGYWMNKLGIISYELGLTQAQKRLISKKIENHEYFQDCFGTFGSSQKELFTQIVTSYCDTSKIDFDVILAGND